MEPYANITPAGGAQPALSKALGKISSKARKRSGGGLLDSLGALAGYKAFERGHQAQMAHEAEQSQLAHERNLEVIDRVHRAGMFMDQNKANIETQAREHVADLAAATREHTAKVLGQFVNRKTSRVGAGQVSFEEGPEGGIKLNYNVAERPTPAPAASKPSAMAGTIEAAMTGGSSKYTVVDKTPKAPAAKKAPAKATAPKTPKVK